MAKAKKTATGLWTIIAYGGKDRNGKKLYQRFTSDSKAQVELLAAQYKAEHRYVPNEQMTFQQASDDYIDSKSNVLSPSTIRGYVIMQRNAFPLLLGKTLGKIVSMNLVQRQMNENAVKYSAKSLRNQHGFITAVFRFHRVPLDNVSLARGERKMIPVPTETEAKRIAACLRECPEIECQALLALTCSLRESEIAALTAVDVRGNEVFIHGSRVPDKNGNLVYKPYGKTDAATRCATMPEYLAERVHAQALRRPSGWLFPMKSGSLLYYFKKMEREHGIPEYTIHSLRHCFAAVMHALNVPDQYVMQLGGWKSDNVLKRVYQYTFQEEAARVQARANVHFEKLIDDKTTNQTTMETKTA